MSEILTREEFVGVITDHGACSPPCSRCASLLAHDAALRDEVERWKRAALYHAERENVLRASRTEPAAVATPPTCEHGHTFSEVGQTRCDCGRVSIFYGKAKP